MAIFVLQMTHFLVEIFLDDIPSSAFYDVIPQHRAFVSDLLNRGTITSYSVAGNRSKLWVTFMAQSYNEVEGWVKRFPISEYMLDYKINELLFHDSAYAGLPSISLN